MHLKEVFSLLSQRIGKLFNFWGILYSVFKKIWRKKSIWLLIFLCKKKKEEEEAWNVKVKADVTN